MSDLVVRPYDRETGTWCLQLRRGGMPETQYITLAKGLDIMFVRELIEAGPVTHLFGDPDKS